MEETKFYDSWGKLTVEQYERLLNIQKEHPDNSAKYIVEYLYDIDNADRIPWQEYSAYLAGLRMFIGEPIMKAKLTPSAGYTLNGRKYRVDITPSAFTVAQYMDFTNYIRREATLTDLLTVVVVPEGKTYAEGYDMQQAREDIGTMPLVGAFAVIGFFARWSKASIRTFLRSLTSKMKDRTGKVPAEKIEWLESEIERLFKLLASYPTS